MIISLAIALLRANKPRIIDHLYSHCSCLLVHVTLCKISNNLEAIEQILEISKVFNFVLDAKQLLKIYLAIVPESANKCGLSNFAIAPRRGYRHGLSYLPVAP